MTRAILIIITGLAWGGQHSTTQEFYTMETCETAAKAIDRTVSLSGGKAYCVAK